MFGAAFYIPILSVFVPTIWRLRPLHASNIISTLCNGCHTSHRMHEVVDRSCPFSCVARDTLSHYADCLILMAACHTVYSPSPVAIPHLLLDSPLAFRLAACNSRAMPLDTFLFMSRCKLIYNAFEFNQLIFQQASVIAARLRTQFSTPSGENSSSSSSYSSSTSSGSDSSTSSSCRDSVPDMHELTRTVGCSCDAL